MHIFDVPIDNLSREALLERIKIWLEGNDFHRIATVNPEFLLLAENNQAFKQALLAADLRIADGVGIYFPFWITGEKLIGHYPGVDLMHAIVTIAEAKQYSVGLALHEHGLSSPEQIVTALRTLYPKLTVESLSPLNTQHSSVNILLCNYGAPLQELHLESLRHKNTSVRLAMGVGGAFDYLTGVIPRAPKWMRSFGLEWLWRLIQQPSRFKRIWNAVVVFPIKVLNQK